MFGFIKELGKIDIEYGFDEEIITFKSYIKNVESDYILIDFLLHKGTEYNIPIGEWAAIKFKEKSGIYSGYCRIIGIDNSKLAGIKISYPTDVKFIQQREYVRVPLKLKAELVIFPQTDCEEVKVIETNTLDISGSGFCFISDMPVEKHSRILGIVNLSNPSEKPIEVTLQHVYSRPFFAGTKELYKNAFTFEEIDEKSKEKILKEIFLYELELRKKRI